MPIFNIKFVLYFNSLKKFAGSLFILYFLHNVFIEEYVPLTYSISPVWILLLQTHSPSFILQDSYRLEAGFKGLSQLRLNLLVRL